MKHNYYQNHPVKWVYQLPLKALIRLNRDAFKILVLEVGFSQEDALERLDTINREKLIDVIGYEPGLLNADRYGKYLGLERSRA